MGGLRWSGGAVGGNDNFHQCAGVCVLQTNFPAKLLHALPHASDSYADAAGPELNDVIVDTFAVVPD